MQTEYIPVQCEHIRDTGLRCGSPAMRGRDFCYYHRRAHSNILPGDSTYELPILESEQAIQLATTHITRAVLKGKLDRRDATTLLQAIRIAQATLKTAKTASLDDNALEMELDLTPAMQKLEACSTGIPACDANASECGADIPVRHADTTNTPQDQVILNGEAAKDLCISASTTNAAAKSASLTMNSLLHAASSLKANRPMTQSPDGPILDRQIKKFSGNSAQRRRARRLDARMTACSA